MEILEHGIYYNKCSEITCGCGCKFRYETSDICIDSDLALTSCPQQYRRYVRCPECCAKIYLGDTYTFKGSGPIISYKCVNGTAELN